MKWVEIESKLEQAKAAESIARQQLSHSTLTAPFSGVIAAKNVDMGTYVLPGQPVLKLANVAQVNAKVSVPEAEISLLHVGDKVKLTVTALSGAVFYGTISEKGIDANPISHTYDIKVGITNPLDVVEQMTYLMFIRDLDDTDNLRAKESAMLGLPHKSIFADEVKIGDRTIPGNQLK